MWTIIFLIIFLQLNNLYIFLLRYMLRRVSLKLCACFAEEVKPCMWLYLKLASCMFPLEDIKNTKNAARKRVK